MEIVTNVADDPNILNIIDITRYSTLVRLLRVTARVINFSRKWRKRKVYSETFTAKDIVEARNVLLKATQHKIYRQEIPYLKNKDKSRQPPIIRQLDLYLDDEDIIRCRGRLKYTLSIQISIHKVYRSASRHKISYPHTKGQLLNYTHSPIYT